MEEALVLMRLAGCFFLGMGMERFWLGFEAIETKHGESVNTYDTSAVN